MMASRASSSCVAANTALRALRRRRAFDDILSRRETRPSSTRSSCFGDDGGDRSPPAHSPVLFPLTAHARSSVPHGVSFSAATLSFDSGFSRCFAAQAGASSKVILAEDDGHYSDVMGQLKGEQTLAVVYFTAQWCGPCRQIAPYIDQLSKEYDDVAILKIDIDKPELAETMKESYVGAVPTFHFYKEGSKVAELTGAAKDKLDHLVKSLRSKS